MTKKFSLLLFFAAILCGMSVYAAPGGTWTTIEHLAYPTPQNLIAELDGSRVTLSWDGVQWPADGFPEEIDGKTVPTNFSYSIECRYKITGTDTWCNWWDRTSRSRLDSNGDFVSHWSIQDDVESGKTYQYRIRCYSYIEPENPWDLTNPTRDGYFSEYSEIVTASKTLDKLEITYKPAQFSHPLQGMRAVNITYTYTSTRAAEGKKPLFFTFKAIEIPYPEPGTATEAPVAGGKPYVRRDGKTLAVKALKECPPDEPYSKKVDPTNFTLTAASGTVEYPGEITWYVDEDLPTYYHTNVTIWVQGWEPSETEGGKPRLVLDEAIGELTIDTRHLTAEPTPEQDGILLTWPSVPDAVEYEIWLTKDGNGNDELLASTAETSYTHTAAQPGVRYAYDVKAFSATKEELDSYWTNGYCRLDAFSTAEQSLYSVQPQTPWNGKVDIVVRYHSARNSWNDGEPYFKLIAENYESGETLTVQTLTRAADEEAGIDEEVLDPNHFGLIDEKNLEQRLVWDAGADLGETLVERLRLTVDCAGVEPYWEGDSFTEWTGSPARYKENVRLDTRSPRIRKLGQGTHAYIDLDWFPGATKADLYCNGTLIHTTIDEYTRTKRLDNEELNIWGVNELKLVPDKGEPWVGYIAYPAFDFTVTKGVADGITLTWNTIDDEAVGGYQILRRKKGATAAFDTLTTVANDIITYTDQTAEEATLYEYTVVPQRTWDANIGPVPATKEGYRTLDKAELQGFSIRWPWNGRVDIDLTYQTARKQYAAAMGIAMPDRTVTIAVTTADGMALAVQSLVRETLDKSAGIIRRETIKNGAFTLGANDRIIWDAPTDAPRVHEPNAVMTITINGDEYSEPIEFTQTFDLDTRLRVIELQGGVESIPIPWSTRWAKPEATQLGIGENDAWWKQTAVLTDATDNTNPKEILRTEAKLGEGTVTSWTPEKWGDNMLTLKFSPVSGINETTEYAAVFYIKPDFTFTATQGNRDSIVLEWNSPKGMRIHSYSIRRRAANTNDSFEEVATCTDTTRWADTSDETIVGEFEYTVMPQTDDNTDAWRQFRPVTGYRALDIARPVTITPAENGTVTPDKTTAKYNDFVTLTVTPATGYELEQLRVMDDETLITVWSEEGEYVFNMPANEVHVYATFKAIDYIVNIISPENGTITADKKTAHYGETVTLTITPDEGYELESLRVIYNDAIVPVTEGNTFVMRACNAAIIAYFKMIDYTVTIQPSESGTITADKETATMGETVTLTVTPNEGYEFDQLTVMNGETKVDVTLTTEGNYTFVMPTGNVEISATYKAIYYNIILVPSVSGEVTADKETTNMGETVTLTVTPDKGYELDKIHVMNGTTQVAAVAEGEGIYTFTMPAGNVVVSSLFKETTSTGVNAPNTTETTTRKVFRDGQVFIIRGNKTYTLIGVEVK